MQHVPYLEPQVGEWAKMFPPKLHTLFLGCAIHYPIALARDGKIADTVERHQTTHSFNFPPRHSRESGNTRPKFRGTDIQRLKITDPTLRLTLFTRGVNITA